MIVNVPSPVPTRQADFEEESYGAGRFVWEIVKVALLAFVVIIPIRVFFFQPFFVQGPSMEPTFKDGEYLIIREFGYKQTSVGPKAAPWFTVYPQKELERFDVAVFHPPYGEEFYIKRVIGLPGETVLLRQGRVTIKNQEFPQGKVIDETGYLPIDLATAGNVSVTLKPNEYFVMGDNRPVSQDSRAFGPVSKDHLTGRVIFRAWPIDRIGFF